MEITKNNTKVKNTYILDSTFVGAYEPGLVYELENGVFLKQVETNRIGFEEVKDKETILFLNSLSK